MSAIEKHSADGWPAFLDGACGDDVELRSRVEELLQAHVALGSIHASSDSPTIDTVLTEQAGSQIGSFKLLQKLGEGGMGVVYLAEQTKPVKRRVALKIIKPGMDTRQVIARFEAERQALAMMDHPHIAKVLDGGMTDSGRPFFAMELVKGIPITRYCDEHRLSLQQRLQLFVDVCHAVQHAHQKGIIHRDLKPSNILIAEYDDQATPKIIDFGVAKAIQQRLTEKTMFTQLGQVVGTPEYMSPEQAKLNQLDIDTRSDIYSLGVLLYELLTGETPFDRQRLQSAAFDEMLRILREEEPPRPSLRLSSSQSLPSVAANRHIEPKRLSTLLRGELDWIVMKALEKERSRRYETANGFAADVLHYLHDEPVQACPPSAAYRLRKVARRYKGPLTAASLLLLALVTVTVGAVTAAARFRQLANHNASLVAKKAAALEEETRAATTAGVAQRAAEEARNQEELLRQQAERQKQEATAHFASARSAVDQFFIKVSENEQLTVPSLRSLRSELISSALEFYDDFVQDEAKAKDMRLELARAFLQIGQIRSELGEAIQAEDANASAIDLYTELRAEDHEKLDVSLGLARAYYRARRYQDAITLCREVLSVEPQHAQTRQLLADTYDACGLSASQKSEEQAALEYHQLARSLRQELIEEFSDDATYAGELGRTLYHLGVLLARQGDGRDALTTFEIAVADLQEAPPGIIWGRWHSSALQHMAVEQAALGHEQQALESFEQATALCRKQVFQHPADPALKADLYRAWMYLSHYQQQFGKKTQARRSARAARQLLEDLPRATPAEQFELAVVYAELSRTLDGSASWPQEILTNHGNWEDDAVQALSQAIESGYRNRRILQSHDSLVGLRLRDDFQRLMDRLEVTLQSEQGRSNQAKLPQPGPASRRGAAHVLQELVGTGAADLRRRRTLAATLHAVGEIQSGLKQFAQAEQTLLDARRIHGEILEGTRPPDILDVLNMLNTRFALGRVYWQSDRAPEAHQIWQQLMQQLEEVTAAHGDSPVIGGLASNIERRICYCYGEVGLWPLASQFAVRNARHRRTHHFPWDSRFIPLMLAGGSQEDYRQYCQHYAAYLGKSLAGPQSQHFKHMHVLWNCGLAEEPPVDPMELIKLGQLALAVDQDLEPSDGWYQVSLALTQYRAGDFQGATTTLTRNRFASDFQVSQHVLTRAYIEALLAFAVHGDDGETHDALLEAESLYRQVALASLQTSHIAFAGRFQVYWWELFYAQRLRSEAWRKIRGDQYDHDSWQHLLLARGYQFIGETEKANAELEAAVEAAPQDVGVWLARIRLRSEAGDPEDLIESDWQRFTANAAADPLPWIHRGRWYAEQGKHQQADADFAHAASLCPDELSKFFGAGWWFIGPYQPGLGALEPPELDPDPSVPEVVIDPVKGLSEEPVRWQAAPADDSGSVRLSSLDMPNESSVYFMTYVYAPTARMMTLRTTKLLHQRHPSYTVWVNGELCKSPVWTNDFIHQRVKITPLALRKGRNVILVKMYDYSSDERFTPLLDDHPLARTFDYLRYGLLDHAEEVLATRYSNQFQAEWQFLDEKYSFAGRQYPELRRSLYRNHRDDLDNPEVALITVSAAIMSPDHDVLQETLLYVAERSDTDSKLRQFPWTHPHLGLVYLRLHRPEDALAVLRKGDNIGVWGRSMLAIAHHELGHNETAAQLLSSAVAELRDSAEAARAGEDFAEETALFSRDCWITREAQARIEGDGEEVDRLYERFVLHRRQHWDARDPDTAVVDDLVLIMPDRAESYLARGRLYIDSGRWDDAETDFTEAIELSPQNFRPLLARAELRVQRGQVSEATDDLVAALLWANQEDGVRTGPLVEAALRRHAAVLGELENRRDPNWRSLRGARASLLGHWSDAAHVLNDSQRYTDAISLAALQSISGDVAGYHETIDRLPQLLREQRDDEAVRNSWQAVSLGLQSKSDPATVMELLRVAQLAADARPNEARYRFAVGLAHFRAGQHETSLSPLMQSLKNPIQDFEGWADHAMAWAVLSMACHHLQQHDEARQWLARCDRWRELSTRRTISFLQGNDRAGRGLGNHQWNMANALTRQAKLLIDGGEAVAVADAQRSAKLAAFAETSATPANREIP